MSILKGFSRSWLNSWTVNFGPQNCFLCTIIYHQTFPVIVYKKLGRVLSVVEA